MIKSVYEETIKPFVKILLVILGFLLTLFINSINSKLNEMYDMLARMQMNNATITQQIKNIEQKNTEQDQRIGKVEDKLDVHILDDRRVHAN